MKEEGGALAQVGAVPSVPIPVHGFCLRRVVGRENHGDCVFVDIVG